MPAGAEGNVMWNCKSIIACPRVWRVTTYPNIHAPRHITTSHPKISYAEFKEVQDEHFQHLDRVAAELVKGYRELLWVTQGRERQRRQLYRNCTLFLIGISVVDFAILSM